MMHENFSVCRDDGCGDDGERFRLIVTSLVERGWDAAWITENIAARPWHFAIPVDWDDKQIQREIASCGAPRAPQETKPAKAEPISVWDDGLPGWLRARIESVEIPADRDQYFREVVAGLACRGWDTWRIMVKIVGCPWIPPLYAATSRALEFGVQTLLMLPTDSLARLESLGTLRNINDAAPDDVAASDVRAVQTAIAAGRWRESCQAKAWVGRAVASALKLDAEADKAKIVALLKIWIESGALIVVEGEDEQRKKRNFVEVGSAAE
jgi:hypothetical protein